MRLLLRSSTALWRRVFRRELLRQYSNFRREGYFPERKLTGFAPEVFEIHRAPCVFLYCFTHFPIVMVRVANWSSQKFPKKFFFFCGFQK
jgi:hypothetical protein